MDWLNEIWNSVYAIFTSADMITLAIIAVVVLAAGFMMEGLGSIVTMTFVALVAFAVLQYIRAVALNGQNASALAQTDWHNFLAWPMQGLVAYAIAFAVLIGVISLIRSLVFR